MFTARTSRCTDASPLALVPARSISRRRRPPPAAAAADGGAAAVVAERQPPRRPVPSTPARSRWRCAPARGRWSPERPSGPAAGRSRRFGEARPAADGAGAAPARRRGRRRSRCRWPTSWPRRCACTACARRDGSPCAPLDVPPGGDARGALRRRPRRHVSLLGDDAGRAGAVPRARRRLHRRSAGRRSRRRSRAGHHRVDEPDASRSPPDLLRRRHRRGVHRPSAERRPSCSTASAGRPPSG